MKKEGLSFFFRDQVDFWEKSGKFVAESKRRPFFSFFRDQVDFGQKRSIEKRHKILGVHANLWKWPKGTGELKVWEIQF